MGNNHTASLTAHEKRYVDRVIKQDEIDRYLQPDGNDFIDDQLIWKQIRDNTNPAPARVREILAKAEETMETLAPDETATLMNVEDEDLWQEMYQKAAAVKKKAYDNRIVTFAPLYCSNLCVNNCLYCSFRRDNREQKRRCLTPEEIRRETEVLAAEAGHKRLIVVYGEHPDTGIDYMVDTIQSIYDVKTKGRQGDARIRRVNVNAQPLSIDDLKKLKAVGIGTYQVFQETYHHSTYAKAHPAGTVKGDYQWRLYALHRAIEAGVDDVAIGALFGLYDWRFEVMGLVYHTRDLEAQFDGIGPHTISFPRLEPADNAPLAEHVQYRVPDEDFKKLVTVLRLSVPYTGMILTARERPEIRREVIPLGITQTDASTRIGIGSYDDDGGEQQGERQQFMLGDTRSLDAVIRELAEMGYITSFCTAGYRCGRTGHLIMDLLKCGKEGRFCKLNAILTFKEWLNDFASPETLKAGETVIANEIAEVQEQMPDVYPQLCEYLERIDNGERDFYF